MYAVSDEYKIAVADSHRKSKMRAVLTVNGTAINLNDSDIIKDSVYIFALFFVKKLTSEYFSKAKNKTKKVTMRRWWIASKKKKSG